MTTHISDLPAQARLDRLAAGLPRVVSTHRTVIESASDALLGLPCIVPPSGDWQQPAMPWSFRLDGPAWVLLSVQPLREAGLDPSWAPLPHGVVWRFFGSARFHGDLLFAKRCDHGMVTIPGHAGRSPHGFLARPHLVLIAPDIPASPPPGQDRDALLAEQQRIESIELAAGPLRATVQLKPALRLTAFSVGDRPDLLAPTSEDPCGIRTWVMEPFQNAFSPLPASRRARCLERGAAHLQLTTDADPESGLELLWHVRLDPQRLLLRHGLRNHGRATRRLALWSLVAGAHPQSMRSLLLRSRGVDTPAHRLRPMAQSETGDAGPIIEPLPPETTGCHDLAGGLVVDGAMRSNSRAVKAGLRSTDGVAVLASGRTALVSRVVAGDAGPYPEGDLNLTTYHSSSIIEIEHVGPLVDLEPSACVWMEQELSMLDLPEHAPADLPGLVHAGLRP